MERNTVPQGDFLRSQPGPEQGHSVAKKNAVIIVLAILLALCAGYLVASHLLEAKLIASSGNAPPLFHQPSEQSGSLPDVYRKIKRQPVQTIPAESAPVSAVAKQQSATTSVVRSTTELPPLNITGYIYFDDAPQRSKLFIDGVVYRYNSRLAQGGTLTGFAKKHVVVTFQGVEHTVPVK